MRVHVVSDVHGRTDALARAGDGADALICLGDLILYLDYADHGVGIMADLFGPAAVSRLIELRTAGRFEEARGHSAAMWASLPPGCDRAEVMEQAVRRQYEEMFAVLPDPSYLTFGNVDLPGLFRQYLRPGLHLLDGEVADIGGLRFGFVGGGLRTPMRTPYEVDDDVFAAKVAALGSVDVLCSHIPPQLPELVYDVEAGRFERGSVAILEAIQRTQPRYALFGHVHQPYANEVQLGRTRCVNVGHFRARGAPWVLEL
ncbi:MAG: metallophosphoesterase family protein [Mycobacteriales bacterium]